MDEFWGVHQKVLLSCSPDHFFLIVPKLRPSTFLLHKLRALSAVLTSNILGRLCGVEIDLCSHISMRELIVHYNIFSGYSAVTVDLLLC